MTEKRGRREGDKLYRNTQLNVDFNPEIKLLTTNSMCLGRGAIYLQFTKRARCMLVRCQILT